MKKTEKELQDDLLTAAALAVHSYEEYLLDQMGGVNWRKSCSRFASRWQPLTATNSPNNQSA